MLIELEELNDDLFKPRGCELEEHVLRGTYSRLADEVRRVLPTIKHLRRIIISQNAPDWRRDADQKINSPKGLTTILALDYNGVAIVHYKTATNGHRAKVFVREVRHA